MNNEEHDATALVIMGVLNMAGMIFFMSSGIIVGRLLFFIAAGFSLLALIFCLGFLIAFFVKRSGAWSLLLRAVGLLKRTPQILGDAFAVIAVAAAVSTIILIFIDLLIGLIPVDIITFTAVGLLFASAILFWMAGNGWLSLVIAAIALMWAFPSVMIFIAFHA